MSATKWMRGMGFVITVALLLVGVASAATVTWTGSVDGNWNTSSGNWSGGAPTANLYVNGDNVTFGATGAGNVYIGTAGPTPVNVAPGSVSITGGMYTFSGGEIMSGTFTKSEAGITTFMRCSLVHRPVEC